MQLVFCRISLKCRTQNRKQNFHLNKHSLYEKSTFKSCRGYLMESKHSQFIPCCANTLLYCVCINRRKILKKRSTNNKIWPFACDHRLKLRKPWAHTLQSVCSLWRRRQRIRHEHAIGYLRLRVFIYLSSWFKLQQRTLSPFMVWYTCMPINNTAYTQVHGALTSPHYTTHIQTEMSQVNILCKIHRHTLKGTRKKSFREKQ